jgi:hypothetical protein
MKITKLSRNKTREAAISIVIVAILFLSLTAIAPVSAVDPSINADTWFVLTMTGGVGVAKNVTSTSTHLEANHTWNLMRSPGTAGTVQIGTVKSQMVADFNNVTNRGVAVFKMTLNFTETNSTKNPYGVGILQVTATANLTVWGSAKYGLPDVPADGTGTLVSTSGTGAFVTASLYGDFVLNPLALAPFGGVGFTQAFFFGTHARVNGMGVLVYYPALAASAFSSVTVMRGLTWNFFVQSTGGVGPYTYQWYEGSTLIAGQTSMILSMNKAAAGTYTYTCIVTDSYGNAATTNVITMTVL